MWISPESKSLLPENFANDSKGAAKNIFWPRKIGGRTAPNFDQKGPENVLKLLLVFQGQFGPIFGF